MKTMFGFSIILILLISEVVAFADSGVVTANSGVNFRSSPNGRIRKALPEGTRVQILSTEGRWHRVRLESGQKGYVFARTIGETTEVDNCPGCSVVRKLFGKRDADNIEEAAIDAEPARGKRNRSDYVQGRFAPIMRPFLKAFDICASDCSKYEDLGVWGDLRHQRKRSCHNTGNAIDIKGIVCHGRTYRARDKKFKDFVKCMRGKQGLHTIFGKGEHKRHAHISLRSCEIGGKGKVRTR